VGQLKLFQVSDICNSSCFNALEFDQYNYYEERYFIWLINYIAKLVTLSGADLTLKKVLIIILTNLILFPIGGYFFGLLTWRSYEKKFNKNKQNSSQ